MNSLLACSHWGVAAVAAELGTALAASSSGAARLGRLLSSLAHNQQPQCSSSTASGWRSFARGPPATRAARRPQEQQPHSHHMPPPQATSTHSSDAGRAAASSPQAITSLIMQAGSPRDLLQLVVQHSAQLNAIHIVAALNRAAKLWKQTATPGSVPAPAQPGATHLRAHAARDGAAAAADSSGGKLVGRQQLEVLMGQLSGPFVRCLPELGVREVSSGLWSYAVCGMRPPPALLAACVQQLCSWDKLQQADPQYTINLTWAAAKLGCHDRQLYSAVAAAVLAHGTVAQLTPAQLAVLAWGFAKAQYRDAALGAGASAAATHLLQRQLEDMRGGATRGSGSSGGGSSNSQQQPGARARRRAAAMWHFSPGSLSGLVWGGTVLGWLPAAPQLLQAAAAVAVREPLVYEFTPRAASNLLWGFAASLRGGDVELWASGGGGAEGSTAPAHSTLHSAHGSTGAAAATAAEEQQARLPASMPLQLQAALQLQAVWAAALALAAATLRRLDEADAAALSRLLWSLATLHGWFLDALWTQQQQQQQHQHQQQQAQGGVSAGRTVGAADAVTAATADGGMVFGHLCGAMQRELARQPGALLPYAAATARALGQAQARGLSGAWQPPAASEARAAAGRAPAAAAASATPSPAQLLQKQLAEGIAAAAATQPQQLSSSLVADLLSALVPLVRAAAAAHTDDGDASKQHDSLAAAVEGLVAVAGQHAAGRPGSVPVQDVSRLLPALSRLKVQGAALYGALLQQWSADALQACSADTLSGALRAAAAFVQVERCMLQAGQLPHQAWEHLLAAAAGKWRELGGPAQAAALQLCATLTGAGLAAGVPSCERVRVLGGGSTAA